MSNYIERIQAIKIELINIILTGLLLYFFNIKNVYIRLFLCCCHWIMCIILFKNMVKN